MIPLLLSLSLQSGAPAVSTVPAPSPHHQQRQKIELLAARAAERPDDAAAWSRLAEAQLALARRSGEHLELKAAEASFDRLRVLDPDGAAPWFGAAYARLGQHRFGAALEAAREAARRLPEATHSLALLGDVHYALGNYLEAGALWRRLEERELTLQSLARRGLIEEVQGRRAAALKFMSEALEAGRLLEAPDGDLAWVHGMLGELHLQARSFDQAEQQLRRALQLDPAAHFAWHVLAEVQQQRGDLDAAEATLRELCAWAVQPSYWIQLGDVLRARGKGEEAAAWYAKAEQDLLGDLAAGDDGHLRELAEYWLEHGGDPAAAAELALRDLGLRRDLGAYETAAWALHRAGRSGEAVEMLREALRCGGGEARLYERGAAIYQAAGQPLAAQRCRQKLQELTAQSGAVPAGEAR